MEYLDLDFSNKSTPSQNLIVSAYWSDSSEGGPWDASLQKSGVNDRIEVGILDKRPALQEDKITFGGALCVIGESHTLKETLFSVFARHMIAPGYYQGSFKAPNGLHPTFKLQIEGTEPPSEECGLHAYFTLPKTFFVDRYAIAEKVPPYGVESNSRLDSTWNFKNWAVQGESDLEAPEWAQSRWGSVVMLEIETEDLEKDGSVTVELPLHLRYLEPEKGKESAIASLPWPMVFWACRAEGQDLSHNNPFDRRALGYDFMFGPYTVYHHLSPSTADDNGTFSTITVPILNLDQAMAVKAGTAILVIAGFLYVAVKIFLNMGKKGKFVKVE